MNTSDTIAAVSSATGRAARMIVRVSGPDAMRLAHQLAPTLDPNPNSTFFTPITFNDLTVPVWIYVFTAPRSYTGDDLIEFHLPGNPLLAQMLLNELLRRGARAAEPGEFTARAYFNGRIDLAEAEGVAATIAAHSEGELRAARQLLGGELARRLRPVMDVLAETLALVEVGIDFSDEDVTFLRRDEVEQRVRSSDAALEHLTRDTARFERLAHEPQVVLVGRPNAGKSTLLNALAGRQRAVVSPIAGTTRDAVSAEVRLRRGMIKLIDVAGLEFEEATDDIERQMQSQALRAIETADAVVLLHDVTDENPAPALPRRPDLVVRTKLDLLPEASGDLAVSAATGANLDVLRDRLDALAFGDDSARPALALNARHLAAIADARAALARAAQNLDAGAEVVAFELRDALDALGRVLGQVSPDDLLGRIFSRFCIGK